MPERSGSLEGAVGRDGVCLDEERRLQGTEAWPDGLLSRYPGALGRQEGNGQRSDKVGTHREASKVVENL